jgi:hypothetical protein
VKKAVSWDVAPCECVTNRRFGGTCLLHLQGRRHLPRCVCPPPLPTVLTRQSVSNRINTFSCSRYFATRSSETSVYNTVTWRHIPDTLTCTYSAGGCSRLPPEPSLGAYQNQFTLYFVYLMAFVITEVKQCRINRKGCERKWSWLTLLYRLVYSVSSQVADRRQSP